MTTAPSTRHGRIRLLGRWGLLLLMAAILTTGLMALHVPSSSRSQIQRLTATRSLAAIHPLASGDDAASAAPADPSPYATLIPTSAPAIATARAYLMDPASGEVFYANNALAEVPMASTTKIMTAVVALTFGKPDQKVTIGKDAVAEQNGENSVANLKQDDVLTLHDLLYALLLPSGDDAAVAVADGVAGSEANFVQLMNLEASLLGLEHTHYTNVHGLDAEGHYTTVGDLARLTRVAMHFPLFAKIVKTAKYVAPSALEGTYTWHTTNLLLTPNFAYRGVIGVKTGHTGKAGNCLVFAASRNGQTLIGVLLGEQDVSGNQRFIDAAALLDWGFAHEANITTWMNAIAGKHTGSGG
jgi:serine-type D-Ala-D-Ala carboxypeptidase (penicillin-binding protein 5/6)